MSETDQVEAGAIIAVLFIAVGIAGAIVAAAARGNGTDQSPRHWGPQSSVTDLADMSRAAAPPARYPASASRRAPPPIVAPVHVARPASVAPPPLMSAVAAVAASTSPRPSTGEPIVVPPASPVPGLVAVPSTVGDVTVDPEWAARSVATTDAPERAPRPPRPARPARPSRPSRPAPVSPSAVTGGPAKPVQ